MFSYCYVATAVSVCVHFTFSMPLIKYNVTFVWIIWNMLSKQNFTEKTKRGPANWRCGWIILRLLAAPETLLLSLATSVGEIAPMLSTIKIPNIVRLHTYRFTTPVLIFIWRILGSAMMQVIAEKGNRQKS